MLIEGQNGETLAVDPTHNAGRVSVRPLEHGAAGGHFRARIRSGALSGNTVVANAPLFSLRWTDPDAVLVLTMLEAFYTITTALTAAQELALEAILASAFTAADSAGLSQLASLATAGRVRKSMAVSRIADLRIADTTLLTAGTRTLDGLGFAGGGGLANVVNPAAGTEYLNPGGGPIPFGFRYEADAGRGEHPIVIAANEGLIVRNVVAWPATCVARLTVNLAWSEVSSY